MQPEFPQCHWLELSQQGFLLNITLNRPQARNAMSVAMAQELAAVFEALRQRDDIDAVILRGAGEHFCAGGDLKDITDAQAPPPPGEIDPLFQVNRRFGDLLTTVDQARQVVITVIQGAARGGGFGLACVADVVIAREDATFAMPETGIGLPGAQIIPFVTLRLGPHFCRRLAATGAVVNGAEMFRAGLVSHLCQDDGQMETTLAEILEQVRGCSPDAIAQTKALVAQVDKAKLADILDEGAQLVADSTRRGDGQEGLAAFFDKRPPKWRQRD